MGWLLACKGGGLLSAFRAGLGKFGLGSTTRSVDHLIDPMRFRFCKEEAVPLRKRGMRASALPDYPRCEV